MNKLEELRMAAISQVLDNRQTDNLSVEVATKLAEMIIEGAAKAAEEASRSFADGDGASGCKVAATAVRCYGKELLQ